MTTTLFAAAVAVVTNLPPVIVEASRLGRTRLEIPAHVEVIERPAIAASGADSTVALLEKRANVFIRKVNGNPALAQVSLRGYGANSFGRTKIVVDGEELNNPDMAPQDLLRVPVAALERVEILHGPQTVLHGGNASAGVINIVSDAGSYGRKTELGAHVGNLGRVGASAATRGGFEDEGLAYSASFDFDRSDGWRRNSGFEAWSVKGALRKDFADGSRLGVRTFFADTQYGLPGGLTTGVMEDVMGWYGGDYDYGGWKHRAKSAESSDDAARNDTYGVSATAHVVLDGENALDGELAFRNRRSRSYGYLLYDVYDFVAKLKYENTARLFGCDNTFDAGTDWSYDLLFGESYDPATASGGDNDFSRFSGALFVRDEFWPVEAVSLFAGVRGEAFSNRDRYDGRFAYDAAGYVARRVSGAASRTRGEVAAEGGVNWRPVEGLKVFAKAARFYHAPLADELVSSYGVPNMDLRPEAGLDFELGFDWTFAEEFSFAFTGYHALLDDEIMYLNSGNANAPDRTSRTGFETSFGWSRDKVGSFGVLYGFVHAVFAEGEYDGNRIPMVPGQRLRVFGEYYLIDEVTVNAGYRFVGEQRYGGDFAGDGGMLSDYCLFDAGVRVTPTWGWLEGFTFAFTVDNLLDKRYCDYGEYFNPWYVYPACGRTFLFSVRYEF